MSTSPVVGATAATVTGRAHGVDAACSAACALAGAGVRVEDAHRAHGTLATLTLAQDALGGAVKVDETEGRADVHADW